MWSSEMKISLKQAGTNNTSITAETSKHRIKQTQPGSAETYHNIRAMHKYNNQTTESETICFLIFYWFNTALSYNDNECKSRSLYDCNKNHDEKHCFI